jgi:hypothetical protein
MMRTTLAAEEAMDIPGTGCLFDWLVMIHFIQAYFLQKLTRREIKHENSL